MYTATKIEDLSVVTRGPLKAELFGVPAGKYITYVRRRYNGMYGEPLEEYPIKADNCAREAWARNFGLVAEVRENVENGVKIHCPAVKEAEPKKDDAAKKSPAPMDPELNALAKKLTDRVNDTVYGICLDNIARLIDPAGNIKALLDSMRAEGVGNETLFKAVTKFLHTKI